MRNLVLLAIRNSYALAVLALLAIGFTLLIQHHGPGRSAFFRQTGEIAGKVHGQRAGWRSYLNLEEENERLAAEVAKLRLGALSLQGQSDCAWDSTYIWSVQPGRIVSGPVGPAGALWLAKPGAAAGIQPGMGVLWNGYTLGVVQEVSAGYSRILPLLNVNGGWSGRLGHKGESGTLGWDGRDIRVLNLGGIPRFVSVQVGDTVFSTGFDGVFPAGVPMGVVLGSEEAEVPDFIDVQLRTLVDFSRTQHVQFLRDKRQEEQVHLMNTQAL